MAVRFRVFLAWGLFIAWVAWLGWQSLNYGRFPVVSHAQFLNADVAVTADMTGAEKEPQPNIHVQKVIWPRGADIS